jgi:hypothetical protein
MRAASLAADEDGRRSLSRSALVDVVATVQRDDAGHAPAASIDSLSLRVCYVYVMVMVRLLPPGPQSLRPGGGSSTGRRLSMLRLSPFRPRLLEMGFVSTGASSSRAASLRHFSVLSGSPPAQRDAELHGRPVGVEADQLKLAREIVYYSASVKLVSGYNGCNA